VVGDVRQLRADGEGAERRFKKKCWSESLTTDPYAKSAAEFAGQIVYVLPALNEGDWARKTIRSFRRSKAPKTDMRFVVVDDGGTDGACKTLAAAKDTTVLRNGEPMGQARARGLAVYEFPDADAYISVDPHEEMITPHGAEILALTAQETGGIVSAGYQPFPHQSGGKGAGCRWVNEIRETVSGKPWPVLKSSHNKPGTERLQPCDLLAGAHYAFTRETFERLGGFVESESRFAWFERGLAVQAKFCGVPQYTHTGVWIRHLYRNAKTSEKANYRRVGAHYWYGYIEAFRVMFRPDIWERVFAPTMETVTLDAKMKWLLKSHILDLRRDAFAERKAVKDEAVVRWMGLGELLDEERGPQMLKLGPHFICDGARLPPEPRVLIVGEDNGDLARAILAERSGARIVIVEADPENASSARADAPDGVTVAEYALGDTRAEVQLHRRSQSTAHSLFSVPAGTGKQPAGSVKVRALPLADIVAMYGPLDLLLLNCEGGELAACRALAADRKLALRVAQFCASFHSRKRVELYPAAERDAALDALKSDFEIHQVRSATELYLLTRRAM
jgi:FkbM family methyltransferase